MITNEITITVLKADEGKYLYNEKEKLIVQEVGNANVDDWREITEEEKIALEKEWEEEYNENNNEEIK